MTERATAALDGVLVLSGWAARTAAGLDRATVLGALEAVRTVVLDTADDVALETVALQGHGDAAALARFLATGASVLVDDAAAAADLFAAQPSSDGSTAVVTTPLGVVVALLPDVLGVPALVSAVVAALAGRDALVVVPRGPAAPVAVRLLGLLSDAATAAGMPAGSLQCASDPQDVDALLADPRVARVVGRHSHPAAVPAVVDAGADVPAAAHALVASVALHAGATPVTECVAVVDESAAAVFLARLRAEGAAVLDADQVALVRSLLTPGGAFDPALTGLGAAELASRAGVVVPTTTSVLVVPVPGHVVDEPLARPMPVPVLAVVPTQDWPGVARAVLRLGGYPLAASVFTSGAGAVARAATLGVDRLLVDVAATSTALLTLFGETLHPRSLVRRTTVSFGPEGPRAQDLAGATPDAAAGPRPAYPHASTFRGQA